MSLLVAKQARSIPLDEDSLSWTARETIIRHLPKSGGPPTKETILKISVDDEIDNSHMEEILRYMLMVSLLAPIELKPLWGHLRPNYVCTMSNGIKAKRKIRERGDWKPKPLWAKG